MSTKLRLFMVIILVFTVLMGISTSSAQGDKFEPNDDMESATEISVGERYEDLHVNQTDVDYFNFTTAKTGTYIVETYESGSPRADTKIEILLPTGGVHETNSNNGTGNFSRTMTSVTLTGDSPSELYIRITEESGGEGYYGLEISYNESVELGEGAEGGFARTPGFEMVFAVIGLLTGVYIFRKKKD
ncbi:MAG: PGF-CTERM sorting domain-containing protein [Archaeoglobaceae archaeon]